MYAIPHNYLLRESHFWIPLKLKVRAEVSGAYPASQSALQIFPSCMETGKHLASPSDSEAPGNGNSTRISYKSCTHGLGYSRYIHPLGSHGCLWEGGYPGPLSAQKCAIFSRIRFPDSCEPRPSPEREPCEVWKFLVYVSHSLSPLRTPIVVSPIILYITPSREFRLQLM